MSEKEYQEFSNKCAEDKVSMSTKARELLAAYAGLPTISLPPIAEEDVDIPHLEGARVLTVGEMFSGPGGIGVALGRSKFEGFSFAHAWATDYDPDTCRTYKENVLKNEPEALSICEDVRKLDIDKLPIVDGFLYGFPCNDFSLVGESKGLHGNFGGLYAYGVKYIDRANPLFFFAENVSGLSSANEGKAFQQILRALNNAGKYGYNITANLYKFEEYGVPQARHRYILIGIRGDLGLRFNVPKPNGVMKSCREALQNIPAGAANQEPTKQTATVIERLKYIREGENVWKAGGCPAACVSTLRALVCLRSIGALIPRSLPIRLPDPAEVELMSTTGLRIERLPIASALVCRPSPMILCFMEARKASASKSEWLFRATGRRKFSRLCS